MSSSIIFVNSSPGCSIYLSTYEDSYKAPRYQLPLWRLVILSNFLDLKAASMNKIKQIEGRKYLPVMVIVRQ